MGIIEIDFKSLKAKLANSASSLLNQPKKKTWRTRLRCSDLRVRGF